MKEEIKQIFTDQIDDPVNPMRSELDRDALFELADNIKANGLINPITVRPVADRFEVVAGHRRLSACKIAGIIRIPCVVRNLADHEVFAIKAAENLERADISPTDEAAFIAEYMSKSGLSVAEVAKSLRRSVGYVESRIAVGLMPDYLKEYLKHGQIKLGVALTLMEITEERIRQLWVDMAVRDGVSVAQAEYWVHGWRVQQLPGGEISDAPPEGYTAAEPQPVMFECAVDNKKYDARLVKMIWVYEKNLPFLLDVLAQIRNSPEPNANPPVEVA